MIVSIPLKTFAFVVAFCATQSIKYDKEKEKVTIYKITYGEWNDIALLKTILANVSCNDKFLLESNPKFSSLNSGAKNDYKNTLKYAKEMVIEGITRGNDFLDAYYERKMEKAFAETERMVFNYIELNKKKLYDFFKKDLNNYLEKKAKENRTDGKKDSFKELFEITEIIFNPIYDSIVELFKKGKEILKMGKHDFELTIYICDIYLFLLSNASIKMNEILSFKVLNGGYIDSFHFTEMKQKTKNYLNDLKNKIQKHLVKILIFREFRIFTIKENYNKFKCLVFNDDVNNKMKDQILKNTCFSDNNFKQKQFSIFKVNFIKILKTIYYLDSIHVNEIIQT